MTDSKSSPSIRSEIFVSEAALAGRDSERCSACVCDSINSPALLVLLRGDLKSELLLQRASDGAAHRVRLQAVDDFVDGRSFGRRSMTMSCACLLSARGRSGAARGARLDRARGVRHVGRFAGALRLFLRRSFPRIDSRRSESGIGGDERDAAAIVVVPPDGVIALGADLLNLCA